MRLLIPVDEKEKLQKVHRDEWTVTETFTEHDDGTTEHGVAVFFDHGAAQVFLDDHEAIALATKILSATREAD